MSAAEAVKARRPVSAATLTRSTLESMARMHEFQVLIDGYFKSPDSDALDDFLMNRMFGSRHNPGALPKAANIMTAIKKTDRVFPHFLQNYDRLSEFAHPNYRGGMGMFGQVDRETQYLSFEDTARAEQELIATSNILIGTLHGVLVIYHHIGETIKILDRCLR